MNLKKSLENHIRGWLPKEAGTPNSNIEATGAPAKSGKVFWYVTVFAVLAVIVVLVVLFLVPFLNESFLNRQIVFSGVVAANVLAAYLIYKGVLPKPSSRERRLSRILLIVIVVVVFAVGLIIGWLSRGG